MGQEKIQRRRFLADILFAGGILSAAAVLASQGRSPQPVATPTTANPATTPSPLLPTPEPHVQGEMEPPVHTPPPPPRKPLRDPFESNQPEPHPAGGVRAPLPEAPLPGRMKMPVRRPASGP